MIRKKIFWLSITSCGLVLLLAIVVGSNQANNSVAGAQSLPITPNAVSGGNSSGPVTPPEIGTTSKATITSTVQEPSLVYIKPNIQSTDLSLVTITKDEVKQHLLKYPGWVEIQSLKEQTIQDIDLITSEQASKLLGDVSVGLPPTAPVYIVKISGSFSVPTLPLLGAKNSNQITAPIAHKVFDAHTGYLLLEGSNGPYDK